MNKLNEPITEEEFQKEMHKLDLQRKALAEKLYAKADDYEMVRQSVNSKDPLKEGTVGDVALIKGAQEFQEAARLADNFVHGKLTAHYPDPVILITAKEAEEFAKS